MSLSKIKRNRYLKNSIITVVILIFCLVILQIKVSFKTEIAGRIIPVREWILSKNVDGNLISAIFNYHSNTLAEYHVIQPERGDITSFQLDENVLVAGKVQIGDTVARMQSNQLEMDLAELNGQYAVEENSLRLYTSGEKQSVIEAARQQLDYHVSHNGFARPARRLQ